MVSTERELVQELSCDELCVMDSRKRPLSRDMKKVIRDRIELDDCHCTVL